ncbi:hypothetical protein GCM10017687_26690 [Streptomyces echinatus]
MSRAFVIVLLSSAGNPGPARGAGCAVPSVVWRGCPVARSSNAGGRSREANQGFEGIGALGRRPPDVLAFTPPALHEEEAVRPDRAAERRAAVEAINVGGQGRR